MLVIKDNSVFTNKRVDNTNDSTLGILKLDGKNIGFVIEDEPREVKVKNETRIPANLYELKIRKELTPLTKRYREKFSWFKYHIELKGVLLFTDVYVHIGNFESDTSGCQIIGLNASVHSDGEWRNGQSKAMYFEWYQAVYKALESGKRVFWDVEDN